jgi:DNA-binding NarL/FixJ family response regulator
MIRFFYTLELFCQHALCLDVLETLFREVPEFQLTANNSTFDLLGGTVASRQIDFLLLCANCNNHLLQRPRLLMEHIQFNYPNASVIVLNSSGNTRQTRALLRSGIHEVVSPQIGSETLIGILYDLKKNGGGELFWRSKEKEEELKKRKLFDLSNKEVQILKVMASGITNYEIGKKLLLTEATVKSYLHRIFHKMDAKTRTQAVMKAYRHSII